MTAIWTQSSTAFRFKSDPLGTFQGDVIQQVSNAPYTFLRWDDYSAVNVDPANGITFWTHHEYAINNSWRTWVQAFTPNFPTGDLDFDGQVGASDLLLLLAAWGACADCNDCPADLDGNCIVGASDLLNLLSNWG